MAIPFQYESEYKRKLCTPDEAARVVKSGDWLDISMGCAFPSLMDAAIAKRKEELYGVKIRGYLIQQGCAASTQWCSEIWGPTISTS